MRKQYQQHIRSSWRKRRILHGKIKLAFITDHHITRDENNEPIDNPNADGATRSNKYFYTGHQKHSKVIEELNQNEEFNYIFTLGDMIDGDHFPTDSDGFLEGFEPEDYKGWNDIETDNKELVIGNHDYDGVGDGQQAYDDLANKYGHGDYEELGGSKFNQTFVIEDEDISVRIICLDVNYVDTTDYEHGYPTEQGCLPPKTISWLEDVFENNDEDLVLVLTHYGIVRDGNFYPDDRDEFLGIVEVAKQNNSNLIVYNLFGHNHGTTSVTNFDNYAPTIYGRRIPTLIDFETGQYAIVTIEKNNISKMNVKEVEWESPE